MAQAQRLPDSGPLPRARTIGGIGALAAEISAACCEPPAAKADKIIKEGFATKVDEQGEWVFVQNTHRNVHDPAYRAVIADITRTVDRFPQATKIKSPLAPGNADQISKDGHSAMVTFVPKGTFESASLYIDRITKAVDSVEARHPGFFVEEMTQVSYVSRFALPIYQPRTFISTGYQGTLGWGFATALGVKAANPDRAVLSVTGDGGFLFSAAVGGTRQGGCHVRDRACHEAGRGAVGSRLHPRGGALRRPNLALRALPEGRGGAAPAGLR